MKRNFGKLLIVVLPIIAGIFLLWPTFNASQLEEKYNLYEKRAKSADSLGKPDEALKIRDDFKRLYGEDYKKAKESRLKLGLDLRGGMYVTMEVDVLKLIEESAIREAVDEYFENVIEKSKNDLKSTDEETIDIFLRNFNSIARPRGKSLISYFDIGDLKDASEEKIVEKLRVDSDKAIDQALEVLRQRIDKYGVSEINIQKQGGRRIVIEMPGVTNEDEMRSLLQTTARLEFKLVRNNQTIVRTFFKIDQYLVNRSKGFKVDTTKASDTSAVDTSKQIADAKKDSAKVTAADTSKKTDTLAAADSSKKSDTSNPYAGLSENEQVRRYQKDHPFTSLFATYFQPSETERPVPVSYVNDNFPEGEYIFRISGDSIAKFEALLKRQDIKSMIPFDLEIAIGAKPDRAAEKQNIIIYDFYSLKRDPELTGDVVTNAGTIFDPSTNQPQVIMDMNDDGSDRWAKITGANIKKKIAIILDGRVYSAPVVQAKITGGRSTITGMSNAQEANLLEIVLKAGALKAPVQIIEERVVGPSLGEDSINSGLLASAIAAALVILYIFIYYSAAGGVADFAVMLNIFLIISALSAFNGTLTLPGIAGIILTIGMAVDANVLIYERVREELAKGRSLRSAIDEGYKRALSAIIDSNVTTFLTALALFTFGTGPIQGFALTLMIGIFGTLFTAITITRAIVEMFLGKDGQSFNFGQPKSVNA